MCRRILNKKKIVHSQGNEVLTLHYLRVSCEEWLPCEEHSTQRGKKGVLLVERPAKCYFSQWWRSGPTGSHAPSTISCYENCIVLLHFSSASKLLPKDLSKLWEASCKHYGST